MRISFSTERPNLLTPRRRLNDSTATRSPSDLIISRGISLLLRNDPGREDSQGRGGSEDGRICSRLDGWIVGLLDEWMRARGDLRMGRFEDGRMGGWEDGEDGRMGG